MSESIHFLIVHGAYGTSQENWFPWLGQKLSKLGKVHIPDFPTPEGQNLEAWLKIANRALVNIEPNNIILVGHSTGAGMILRMAEQTLEPYKALFPICPFDRELGIAQFDELNQDFFYPTYDWEAVIRGAYRITCFAGENDPYVPLDQPTRIAKALNAELITVKKGGHLNAEAGYVEFPALLNKILQLCEKNS